MKKIEKSEKSDKSEKSEKSQISEKSEKRARILRYSKHLRWPCPSIMASSGGSLTLQGPPVGSTILSAYLCYMGQAEKRRCGSQPPGQ